MNELGRLRVRRKTGAERFHKDGEDVGGADVLDFWGWSGSDLVNNVMRGVLAEYLVARALGIDTSGVREEWASFDLQTATGVKVEVKSAAYVQSWHQAKLSPISFLTPATHEWDSMTNVQSTELKRQADVYVFALLAHNDKATIDPLNVEQWRFYVLPTAVLNARTRSQHSITLNSLCALCGDGVRFENLRAAVDRASQSG
jgi:hypothetical protein